MERVVNEGMCMYYLGTRLEVLRKTMKSIQSGFSMTLSRSGR